MTGRLFVLAAVLLAAAAPVAAAQENEPAGATLDGASCSTAVVKNVAAEPGLPLRREISCADTVVGSIAYAPLVGLAAGAADRQRRELVVRRFSESRSYAELQQRMLCSEARWLEPSAPGGAPLMAVPCTLSDGGLPHLVLVAAQADHIAVADGTPAMLPALLAALKSPGAGDGRERHLAMLETIWGKPVELAASADLERLSQALRTGRTANGMSKFADAEIAFREALDLQTGPLKANDEAVAATLLDLALNVSNQGRTEEAAALFRRATPLLQASVSEVPRARLATYMGLEAGNRGDFVAGLAYSRDASELWRKLARDRQSQVVTAAGSTGGVATAEQGELANALNLQARMELRSDNVIQAYAAASEALLILNKADSLPRWWKADSLLALGEVSVAQGRLSAAETYLNAALALRRQLFGDGAPSIQVLAALGKAYQTESMNTSTIVTYREIFKLARAMPSTAGIFTAEMLMPFASAVVSVSETLNDPVERRGLFAEAFDAFQLVQSPVIDKTIAQAAARLSTDNPEIGKLVGDLQDRQREYDFAHVKLAHEQSLPDNERSGQVENALKAQVAAASRAIVTSKRALTKQFPDYDRLASPGALDLDRLRSLLRPKEGVVSFLVGRERSFAQLVTREGVVIAPVPEGAAALRSAVTALRRTLEVQGSTINEFNLDAASQLHDVLLGGLKSDLAGLDHLIVVPAGPLSNLPFGLLVASAPNGASYSNADWLVRSKTIAYTPSLQSMSALRNAAPRTAPRKALLAFGDPALSGQAPKKGEASAMSQLAGSCREGGAMPSALLQALAPLPDTARELGVVARTLSAPDQNIFLGGRATESNLREQSLDDYRILYFATHGLLPGELKCQGEPGLVLTPPTLAQGSKALDGLLESSEIASLRLNADLVVLSACNTAASDGRFGGGDALSGLAEAFFHAGARNMLVTHWQVPSAATTELMSGLFTTWGANESDNVSNALREAQLGLIAQSRTAHPFFWAAFVVMGDGQGRVAPVNLAAATISKVTP